MIYDPEKRGENPEEENYIERARRRARKKKSAWNFFLILFAFLCIPTTTYGMFYVMWHVHCLIYPDHLGKSYEFWSKGISGLAFFSSILLLIPLFFASIPISLVLSNLVVRSIPQARRTLDQEAKKVKGGSYSESMAILWKICRIAIPICILLSLLGATTLKNLK